MEKIDWEEKDCPYMGKRCIKEYCLAFEVRGTAWPPDNKTRWNYCRALDMQLGDSYQSSNTKANENDNRK